MSRRFAAIAVLLAGLGVRCWFGNLVQAASPFEPPAQLAEKRAEAEQDLEIARLRLRLFERVDYPLRLRELERGIDLLEAEVASLKRQVKELEKFERYGTGALTLSLERTRLQLLDSELQLRDARHERVLLQLHARDELRLRKLQIDREARRIAGL